MKGIYKITNIVNNKYYIGSSKDIEGRFKNHKSHLKRNKHRNGKLQSSYNKHGLDSFIFEILEILDDSVTKEDLLRVEQTYLDKLLKKQVYNLNFTSNSGGAEVLKIPCYLLDLYGNILNKFDSISECYKDYLKINTNYSYVNKGMIHLKKYRVVTPDFYENNKDIIFSWRSVAKIIPEVKEIKPIPKIYCDYDNEILEFNSMEEAAKKLELTRERIRQILKCDGCGNKYYIRYDKNDVLEEKLCATINNKNYKFDSLTEMSNMTGIFISEIRAFLAGKIKNNFYNIRFLNDSDIISTEKLSSFNNKGINKKPKNLFPSWGEHL